MSVSVETLISRSEARIGDVHPSLKEYAIELIKRCYKEGIRVQLSSGYRSPIDQAYIYGQGRSSYIYNGKQYGRIKDANGNQLPIISNAKPGTSIHNYGLAIDYFLVTEDGNNSIWTVNADWKRVAAIAKLMGFEWGGDWSSFKDYPHLQYTKGLTLTQIAKGMRPAFPKLLTEEVKTAEAKEVSTVEEYPKDAKPSPTLATEFNEAVELEITDGTYPTRPATRQEVAVMILRGLKK